MTPGMFENRERALEDKYARDAEFRFRVDGQAVRLFGLWAAKQQGKADGYADELIAELGRAGLPAVIRRVLEDFSSKGVDMTEHHLENQYSVHLAEAKKALSK